MTDAGFRADSRFGAGLVAVGIAALMMSYFAVSARRVDAVVSASFPCQAERITDLDVLLSPQAWDLPSSDPDDVYRSQVYVACVEGARDLFAREGIANRANSLYWPLILVADMAASVLVLAGWTLALLSWPTRNRLLGLGVLTLLVLIGASAQWFYAETIGIVTVLVD